MLKKFMDLNKSICLRFDGIFVDFNDQRTLKNFFQRIRSDDLVADVGGGKKPAKYLLGIVGEVGAKYDGFDLDRTELLIASDHYSNIYEQDITKPDRSHNGKYDKIICMNTLEHVLDAKAAMNGLSMMLSDGGLLYVKVPYRSAIFAIINKRLPNEFKRKTLHYIFPNKIGDGFPAFYLGCALSEMENNAAHCGLELVPGSVNKVYMSTYFTFFFPFYLVWRLATVFQYLFDRNYCESFEVIFRKKTDPGSASA